MWPAIARTGRRLFGVALPAAPRPGAARPDTDARPPTEPTTAPALPGDPPGPVDDVLLTLGRSELERLGVALQGLLGPGTTRPDTPVRLEDALAMAVERLGGSGRPAVTRRPAGLSTPEAWQVRLAGVEPALGDAVRRATRTGAFAP